MVQPVTASPSCILSYSPCSLISDLIQRVADCVAVIFNAIAGLFSSCFGQETTPPVLPAVAVPIAALAPPIPQPSYNPLQMIDPAEDLDEDAHRAAVENGTRFLLDQLQVLKRTDRPFYEHLLANLEMHPLSDETFTRILVCYFLSLPSFDQPNVQVLQLRNRFAALSDEERPVAMEALKTGAELPLTSSLHMDAFMGNARSFYGGGDVFSDSAKAAHRALIEAGEIIDTNPLIEEGAQFLLRALEETDAPEHRGLLKEFNEDPYGCLYRLVIYHLIFPANIVSPSDPDSRFLNHLKRTRTVQALEAQIASLRATFKALSPHSQEEALREYKGVIWPSDATEAFYSNVNALIDLVYKIKVLQHCTTRALNHQSRQDGL